MKLKDKPKKFYICDPNKNEKCKKGETCGLVCFCTTKRKYAKYPNHPLTYEEYAIEAANKVIGHIATYDKKEQEDGK